MSTITEVRDRMMARSAQIPTGLLCESLETLDRKRKISPEEMLTRSVLIDTLCERHPEADAAFDVWAEGDSTDFHAAVAAITGAARQAVRNYDQQGSTR